MKNKKWIALSLSMILILALAAGCSVNTKAPVDAAYSVTDSQQRVLTFESVPGKVVSLAPTVTEIIFALGAESTLAARTDWCNYPDEVQSYASVGNMDMPDVEKIISLGPDVVFLSEMTKKEIADQLANAGITYMVVKNEDSLEGAYQSIGMVAMALGKTAEGDAIVAGMKQKVEKVMEIVRDAPKPTVYYVMGFGEYGDYTAGKGTFISEMIRLAGGINVANDTEGWSYSLEKIIEHNPDILICSLYSPPDQIREANGYKTLDAVKNNRMHVINDDMLQRLGPRLADALEELARALHPDLF
ncbi:MAG: ABC transporter substrate-binding protein [Clostridia bacterium]